MLPRVGKARTMKEFLMSQRQCIRDLEVNGEADSVFLLGGASPAAVAQRALLAAGIARRGRGDGSQDLEPAQRVPSMIFRPDSSPMSGAGWDCSASSFSLPWKS